MAQALGNMETNQLNFPYLKSNLGAQMKKHDQGLPLGVSCWEITELLPGIALW